MKAEMDFPGPMGSAGAQLRFLLPRGMLGQGGSLKAEEEMS